MKTYINPYKKFTGIFIPDWLLESECVSMQAKLVYALLCKFAGENGHCFPSQKTLAEKLKVSDRSIRNYINELIDAQLIDVRQMGLKKTNRYYFLDHADMYLKAGPENISTQDRKEASTQDRKTVSTPIVRESEKESHSKDSIYPFDAFWDDYDHKKERKKCERKWKKLSEDERETIKEFVPIYLAHTPDKNYRKYPSTFLNNEIWNDDWDSYKPKTNTNGTTKQNRAQRYIDRAQGVLSQLPE